MRRILGHLTYANVMATLAVFIGLGGTALAGSVIITDNSEVAPNTISGHNPPSGDHANIISGSVSTIDLEPGSVTVGRLGADSVTSGKILDGEVQTADVALGAVIRDRLGQNSVGTGKIINGDVKNEDLGFGAVDAAKVQAGSLTGFNVQNRGLSDSDIGSPALVAGADLPNVAANSCISLQLNFGGWDQVGELVFANAADGGVGTGLFITPLVVTTPGTAFGRLCNATTSANDPPAEDILAWSIRQ
jgi:hypothetical protein